MTLIESWSAYMSLLHDRAPVTAQAVRAPRSASDRRDMELTKVPWNDELQEFYSLQDGQRQTHGDEPDVGTVLPQLWLLGIDDVVEHHARCRETQFYTDHLGADWPRIARDQPAGAVVSMFRDTYVPFATTGDGNYLCVDTGYGEHHGCVREFSLEFADEGGPLFSSLDAYSGWLRLNVQAVNNDSLSAPLIDAGVLRWRNAVPEPSAPTADDMFPDTQRLPLPFPPVDFLPSSVGPDDETVDLDEIAERVLEVARALHPGSLVEGGRCVYSRVPRRQGIGMNSFVTVDGVPTVYATIVTGVGNDVLIYESPPGGYIFVHDDASDGADTAEAAPTRRTFARASFLECNAPRRGPSSSGQERPALPDLHDYDWADDPIRNGYMFDAYCLTIITGITIAEFLTLVPTPTTVGQCDFETLSDRGMDIFRQRTPGGSQGLLEHAGAVVMFESNGYHPETHKLMGPLSVGRTVVSQYTGGHGRSSFNLWVDGGWHTTFEPFQAHGREGDRADELVPLMRAIGGFWLDYDEESENEDAWMDLPYTQACFALAEALTGIRLTLDLLRESTYLSLDIPIPD